MTSFQRSDSPNGRSNLKQLRHLAGSVILTVGVTMPCLSAFAESGVPGQALSATPLVLKDGRIAQVSVHTIPFSDDAAALASKAASDLADFTQSIANDCFLTAQVIGHVDKTETTNRETADIHRLARARADSIQDSLIEHGLPAASIASVWDWQFMVQHARATLWVFRLTPGDDCEGNALSPAAAGQVAKAQSGEQPKAFDATTAQNLAVKQAADQPASPEQRVVAAAKPTPTVTKPIPESRLKTAAKPGDKKQVKAAAATRPDKGGNNPDDVDKEGSAKLTEDGALEIIFATNSSYFPKDAGDQLRAFLKTLDKDSSHVIQVQTSVDGKASVSGASSDDEAARYNGWLAERRFERVQSWLMKNSDGRALKIEPTLIENDGSRRVRLQPNPLS